MLKWLWDDCATLGGRILCAPRAGTIFFLVAYGAVLIALSLLFGLDFVTRCDPVPVGCKVAREVGFLAAPNWTITAVAIWPAMFFVLRSILASADRVFDDIDSSPMTWLADDPAHQKVAATWATAKQLLQVLCVFFLLAALVLSIAEWSTNMASDASDQDWSVGGGTSAAARNAVSFLAFLYQGVAIALMLAFAAATLLIARTVGLHGTGEAAPPLLVDIESNDPAKRAGFERFVVLIDQMILFVGLAFANFFLTRIQNAYLRHGFAPPLEGEPPVRASLWDFLRQDFAISTDQQGLARLFESSLTDVSSVAVAIGAVIGLFQCFFFFNATLRHTATLARNRSDHELVRGEPARRAEETGLDRIAVRDRLQNANVWPLGYSDLLPTLSFLAICIATIIFYRIGIYLVFIWIAGWILSRTAAGLLRR